MLGIGIVHDLVLAGELFNASRHFPLCQLIRHTVFPLLKCLSPLGILNICNLWILLRKIVIYLVERKCHLHGLFAVKVDGNDVDPGICKEVFI